MTRRKQYQEITAPNQASPFASLKDDITDKPVGMIKSVKLVWILVVLLSLFVLATGYFFWRSRQFQAQLRLPTPAKTASPSDTQKLVEMVGQLMVLPNEEPTIATVTDIDRLKSTQPFFANAKNGDKVLIYSNKAILYDPQKNKIVEVATINFGSGTQATASAEPKVNTMRFVLRNGTKTVGLTKIFEAKLKKVLPEAEIVAKENASKQDYPTSLLIDVLGDKKNEASKLTQRFGLKLEALPQGESTPDADFLIILGNDQM